MSAQQPQSQVEQAGLTGGRTFVRRQGVEWPPDAPSAPCWSQLQQGSAAWNSLSATII